MDSLFNRNTNDVASNESGATGATPQYAVSDAPATVVNPLYAGESAGEHAASANSPAATSDACTYVAEPAPQQDDFIDSCKTRRKFCLNEETGFRSCTMFNLAIAAERLGRGFEFDPVTLHAKNDEAAERFLYQEDLLREPWKTEFFKA